MSDPTPLLRLPLHDLHVHLGGKMVGFAGYEMPVQYGLGVLGEHLHTRAKAGLFDVSHMGQILVYPLGTMEELALGLESLMPVDVLGLAPWRQRYGMLTNDAGGILDDLMVAHRGDHYLIVVNAACKAADFVHFQAGLEGVGKVTLRSDRALLALQGPLAEGALAQIIPGVADMRFMDVQIFGDIWVSRSGYTGEDGFEISVPIASVQEFAQRLLALPDVALIGLGARDSLRLEAGMPLYGHDIDAGTSPVEAGLDWAIGRARRAGGARAGGFAGADRILAELAGGPARRRVGLRPDGRAPMREGVALFAGDVPVGSVTSGGFGPSLGGPVSMGYVDAAHAAQGTELTGDLRGKRTGLRVASMPFHPTSYKRKEKL